VKGAVHSETPAEGNKYNQNFRNRFCGCNENYDAHAEKGTMFQCIGLGSVDDGGCGEDWWHAECIVGLPRGWYKKAGPKSVQTKGKESQNGDVPAEQAASNEAVPDANASITAGEAGDAEMNDNFDEDPPLPPGFPHEDDFDAFICYKCVEAFPWIRRYAGTEGFLPAVPHKTETSETPSISGPGPATAEPVPEVQPMSESRKRKASDDSIEATTSAAPKRQRSSSEQPTEANGSSKPNCVYDTLPSPPTGTVSLFLTPFFRSAFCKCPAHFPLLTPHPALLDEEETYEPPVSESDANENRTGSVGSRSLLDMGEAALSNVDRVRAIEGVMVYNHLKDKVKGFLKPFADSGVPVGAEDIKRYFEQLRGEGEVMKEMRGKLATDSAGDGTGEGDSRKEQGGY
jgi:E3 ubiquitin-protein ligase UBR7